jgi:histone demethylase JARID1
MADRPADAPAPRSRKPPPVFDSGGDDRALSQAIHKSRLETRRSDARCPPAPVFRPTEEEFADPLAYIATLRAAAEPSGMAKIVPPPSAWP